MSDIDESPRLAWERRAEWPLTVLALVFLAAYAVPILRPHLAQPWLTVTGVATAATWAAFAVDYLVRLLAGARGRFVRSNLLDLAVIVLLLLRLLRLVTVLSVLNRRSGHGFRGRVAVYVVAALSLLTFVAGLAVLDAEREAPEANIVDFGDALWWAMTTVTTVGYGDRFPVTAEGRLVGVGLMLAGGPRRLLAMPLSNTDRGLSRTCSIARKACYARSHRDEGARTGSTAGYEPPRAARLCRRPLVSSNTCSKDHRMAQRTRPR